MENMTLKKIINAYGMILILILLFLALSEEWSDLIHRLRAMTAQVRPLDLDGRSENLLWQTL